MTFVIIFYYTLIFSELTGNPYSEKVTAPQRHFRYVTENYLRLELIIDYHNKYYITYIFNIAYLT